jgi:F0F1-type ATP synthase membrane subunit b/b'
MCAVLFKFAYEKFQTGIEESIKEIRLSIEGLERRREEAILKLNETHRALEEAKNNAEKSIQEAEVQAKKITDQSAELISRAMEKKLAEYDKEIEQIKIRLYAELHHGISEMIMKEIKKKVISMKTDRDFHNVYINKAITAIDQMINGSKRS